MQPDRGDVVRSSDPFKLGEDGQRPWLIVNNDLHSFADEQYLAVTMSTTELEESIPPRSDNWRTGGVPRGPFVSPWAVRSPRIEDLVGWQGRLTDDFVEDVVETVTTYLR